MNTDNDPELDPFDFKAKKEKRKQYPLTINIDPGSTEYLFSASYSDIVGSFKTHFKDANFERDLALHSPAAGTTIQVILTAASVGAGIVAAEIAKEMAKDLWKAIKECIKKSKSFFTRRPRTGGGADRIQLTVTRGYTDISLTLENIGTGDEERVRQFIFDALPKLVALKSELDENNGRARVPEMIILPSTEHVHLAYENEKIQLRRPLCIACQYLEAPYLSSPCQTCWHYQDKPGQHAGRPGVTMYSPDGTTVVFDDFNNPIPIEELVEYTERSDNYSPR